MTAENAGQPARQARRRRASMRPRPMTAENLLAAYLDGRMRTELQ